MSNFLKILLIGVGPNADRTFLPAIQQLQKDMPIALRAVVDVESAEKAVKSRLTRNGYSLKKVAQFYTKGTLEDHKLSSEDIFNLDQLYRKFNINTVIISTEPTAHKAYALWALSRNLPILMDKPITTRVNAAHDIAEAKGIYGDYKELMDAYTASSTPFFSINTQRRYHPGFDLVFEKVKDIKDRFGNPVSAVQSLHADGQWRMPSEITDIDYHGFNKGHGKLSHSGYHFVDVIAKLIKLSFANDPIKTITDIGVFTSFVEPNGLLNQLGRQDYSNIFGSNYAKISTKSDEELYEAHRNFGEIDVSSMLQLINKNDVIGNITLNLLHNSFSRRSWLLPNGELYHGNGRVKHEYHNIQQGPFQNIQIHSYQQSDKHNKSTQEDYGLGGNNHFDVYVFRNKAITGDKKALEVFSMKDLAEVRGYSSNSYAHDQIKHSVVKEFFDVLLGEMDQTMLVSPFESHELSALLMSLVYQSGVLKQSIKHSINPRILR